MPIVLAWLAAGYLTVFALSVFTDDLDEEGGLSLTLITLLWPFAAAWAVHAFGKWLRTIERVV
jgi:hypothetical protein